MVFSQIVLDQEALESNLHFIRNEIGANTELVAVVKGNAYGHGIETFVQMLSACGVNSFAVFNSEEAARIVQAKVPYKRLIIMGAIHVEELLWAVKNNIECYVFTFSRLKKGIEVAKKLKRPFRVHVEVETGMNRTGFEEDKWQQVCDILLANKENVQIEGLCTHLAGAEDISNYLRIQKQLAHFRHAQTVFKKNGISYPHDHIACSACVINYPETIGSLVRVGILQYGFWPSKETKMAWFAKNSTMVDPLRRIINWKSEIMSIKEIQTGEYVGYGLSFLSESPMRIATVPIGYSNGFSRSLSNRGKALVKGVRVDTIGIVNMNILMLDVTNVPDIEEGDEVVLIGEQDDQVISVASFSDFSNLLNYELLTRLPERITRIKK